MSLLLLLTKNQLTGAAWTRVQQAANGANGASTTVTLGTTPVVGNLLVAWANSDLTVTMNGLGWTVGPSVLDSNAAYFWWKVAGASEATSVTFTPSSSDFVCAGMIEYNGNTTNPLDATGTSSITVNGSTSSDPVSVVTTAATDLGVTFAALHNSTASAQPTGISWTSSWTNVQAQGIGGGSTKTYTWYADNLSLGVIGTKSTTASWTGSWPDVQQLTMTFLIAPPLTTVGKRVVVTVQAVNRAASY